MFLQASIFLNAVQVEPVARYASDVSTRPTRANPGHLTLLCRFVQNFLLAPQLEECPAKGSDPRDPILDPLGVATLRYPWTLRVCLAPAEPWVLAALPSVLPVLREHRVR